LGRLHGIEELDPVHERHDMSERSDPADAIQTVKASRLLAVLTA
jgi:hypothetical protein